MGDGDPRRRVDPGHLERLAEELLDRWLAHAGERRAEAHRDLEVLAEHHPSSAPVLIALARIEVAITEESFGVEAEGAVARLRNLARAHPDEQEIARQLCYALFNRYCDEGLPTYLRELACAARGLPDREDLVALCGCADYDPDEDDDFFG